jgi:hypothetical protein
MSLCNNPSEVATRLPLDRIICHPQPIAPCAEIIALVRTRIGSIHELALREPKWMDDHDFVITMAEEFTRRRKACSCTVRSCRFCPRHRVRAMCRLISDRLRNDRMFCRAISRIGTEWWAAVSYRIKRSREFTQDRALLGLNDDSILPRNWRPSELARRKARNRTPSMHQLTLHTHGSCGRRPGPLAELRPPTRHQVAVALAVEVPHAVALDLPPGANGSEELHQVRQEGVIGRTLVRDPADLADGRAVHRPAV